jgi:glutamine synthetase
VRTPDGDAWPGDPRTALQAIVAEAGDLASSLTIATELEFYVLDASRSRSTVAATSTTSAASARRCCAPRATR